MLEFRGGFGPRAMAQIPLCFHMNFRRPRQLSNVWSALVDPTYQQRAEDPSRGAGLKHMAPTEHSAHSLSSSNPAACFCFHLFTCFCLAVLLSFLCINETWLSNKLIHQLLVLLLCKNRHPHWSYPIMR
jgi:hypothetical protein